MKKHLRVRNLYVHEPISGHELTKDKSQEGADGGGCICIVWNLVVHWLLTEAFVFSILDNGYLNWPLSII